MGIFYKQVKVFNRAPVAITVRFDGQDMTLPPGEGVLPQQAIQYAKNQNPIMGSQDPSNPSISGASFLIGVVGSRDNCEPLTPEEWEAHLKRPMRLDEQALFEERYGNDPKARLVLHGRPNSSVARSRHEAGGESQGISSFDHEK